MTPPSAHRLQRMRLVIASGYLRDLRMRSPACSLGVLSRMTEIPLVRLSALELNRGAPASQLEIEAITRVLYDRAVPPMYDTSGEVD
jgi:hypothetical protein